MERLAQTTKKPLTCHSLTIMVGVSQGPGFIRVKMRVTPYPRPREVCVSQEASLSIKRRAVAVETGCEDDGDVYITLTALQRAVGHGLEVQWRNALPHIKCPPDGFMSLPRTHLRGHILYTGGETRRIRLCHAWNLSFYSFYVGNIMCSNTSSKSLNSRYFLHKLNPLKYLDYLVRLTYKSLCISRFYSNNEVFERAE